MNLDDALRGALAREHEPSYLLDRQGRIVFVNDAWDRCLRAAEVPTALNLNAESMLGRTWLDGIHGRPRRYYAALAARALRVPNGEALVHLSEANDEACARVIATRLVPLYASELLGLAQAQWLWMTHTVVAETPLHARYVVRTDWREDGEVPQCSCCRRVRIDRQWELVPRAWAAKQVKWTLCRDCVERYYGPPSQERLRPERHAKLPQSAHLWLRSQLATAA